MSQGQLRDPLAQDRTTLSQRARHSAFLAPGAGQCPSQLLGSITVAWKQPQAVNKGTATSVFEQIFKEQGASQVGVIGHRLPTPVLKHVVLFSRLRKIMFKNRETCLRSFQSVAWKLRVGVSAPTAGSRGALRADGVRPDEYLLV